MATPIPSSLSDALSYTDRGRGEPLVLLHGFPVDRRMWDAQVERLSEHYRVLAPDLRGFGRSGRSDPFSIESLADDVHVFVEQMGAKPCVLGGFSMGGYVALAYAKKYAAELRALILVDTKAEGDTPEGKQGRDKMIALVRSSGVPAVAEQMLPKMLTPGSRESRPAVVKALRTLMENCPPHTIEYALAAMRDRPDRSAELASIKVPTLIVVGDSDEVTPLKGAQAMQGQISGAKLEVIRGAAHMSPMEQPEQVNAAVEQFLATM